MYKTNDPRLQERVEIVNGILHQLTAYLIRNQFHEDEVTVYLGHTQYQSFCMVNEITANPPTLRGCRVVRVLQDEYFKIHPSDSGIRRRNKEMVHSALADKFTHEAFLKEIKRDG